VEVRGSHQRFAVSQNYVTHPHLDCLKHIHLESLPSKTPHPWCIPVNMEIVKNLKTYRGKLVNYILGANEKMLTSSSTAREVGVKVNLLRAVQFVTDNCREISSKTIQNCFAHCGLKHPRL